MTVAYFWHRFCLVPDVKFKAVWILREGANGLIYVGVVDEIWKVLCHAFTFLKQT